MYFHFKFMCFLWQLNIIDTLRIVNYFVDVVMQHGFVVVATAGLKHLSEVSPKIILEPFVGLGESLRYIHFRSKCIIEGYNCCIN
jgi:hypothetical protein